MKKILCILLCLLVLVPAGCKKTGENTVLTPGVEGGGADVPYKIAVVTGDTVYSEAIFEARRQAANNPCIITRTFPDDMSAENTISICTELAADPLVKSIVFVRAVAGIDEAVKKVKAARPDILFIAGADTEDAGFVAQTADLVMTQDMYNMGTEVINEAYRMGAKTFIHYTFARHLLSEPVLRRREAMVKRCEELGITFIDVTSPDPHTAEGGGGESRLFVEEDVSTQVGDYGANTAFFSTDCTIHTYLIKAVLENGAIYPQQCCPNPFHGYTAYFGIDSGEYNDPAGILRETSRQIAAYGMTGRMATWPLSPDILMVKAGVTYALAYCNGEVGLELDREKFDSIFDSISDGRASVRSMGHAPNCLLFLCEYYML
ncbi:MAG: DUF3798 domain-containing protein [Clostridia bacterium]|nr:DUF3798 domain-containing protein [Oscillospiraceae bacterium]MBQ7033821.1 DUF3798 domain-containing protein [Clostridia bacterium]